MNETIPQTKICTACNKSILLSGFSKDKSTKDGFCYKCKTCTKEYKQQYKINNRETIANGNKIYREKNLEKIKEEKKKYYTKNKDKISKKCKQYYTDNKNNILKTCKIYRENNKEKIRAYSRTEKGRAIMAKSKGFRRMKKRKGDVTSSQIEELIKKSNVCYWCGIKIINHEMHIDHYVPLSKGGEHTISNLVVSCPACNLKKSAKDPLEFANSIGRLL